MRRIAGIYNIVDKPSELIKNLFQFDGAWYPASTIQPYEETGFKTLIDEGYEVMGVIPRTDRLNGDALGIINVANWIAGMSLEHSEFYGVLIDDWQWAMYKFGRTHEETDACIQTLRSVNPNLKIIVTHYEHYWYQTDWDFDFDEIYWAFWDYTHLDSDVYPTGQNLTDYIRQQFYIARNNFPGKIKWLGLYIDPGAVSTYNRSPTEEEYRTVLTVYKKFLDDGLVQGIWIIDATKFNDPIYANRIALTAEILSTPKSPLNILARILGPIVIGLFLTLKTSRRG